MDRKVKTGQPIRRRRPNGGKLIQTTSTPAAKQVVVANRPPVVRTNGNCTRITAHEQIYTVNGSVGFTATKFQVNPGLPFYTWLSQRAAGWEKYRLDKFEVMYIPAEANTTTPGSVYFVADYDPSDPPPSSLQALSTYEHQVNGRVYNALTLDLSPKRMFDGVQTKYIRQGPVPNDLALYDAASFTFATISCANGDPIGQIWVNYTVELISPQTEVGPGVPQSLAYFSQTTLFDQDIDQGVPLNVEWSLDVTNGPGVLYNPSTRLFTLPKANYLIDGVLTLEDPAGGTTTFIVELLKNGGAGVNATSQITNTGATTSNIPFSTFFASNGTDTFGMVINLLTAGTITLKEGGTCLRFRVV